MTHTPAALANIAGEAIYQDRNATTYYVTPPAARKDPHVLANIQVWSHFIARQYNPETVDQAVSEWIDEDYVWYGLNVPQGIRGPGVRKGFMKNALGTSQGLSDFHITNRMFGEGDRVVNFWQMEGVHTGEYCGQPPSGKKVRFTGIAISSFRNGKQLEEWEYNEDFMANVKAVVDADVAKALATELTEREQSMVENIANWQQTVDEKMNLGRFDRIDSTYSEDYVYHGGGGFELSGPAALSRMKSGIEGFRAAFSDLKITNDMFGDGDRAIIAVLQSMVVLILVLVGRQAELGSIYYLGVITMACLFVFQQHLARFRERDGCFKAFLNNNWAGFAVFLGLLIDLTLAR